MDVNELNIWLETEKGRAWAETLKKPLLDKRDELLAALKESNAKLATAEQRSTAAAEELSQEREALSNLLIDKEASRMLKERRVMELSIPSIVAALKETHGIQVKADGPNRQAVGKIKGEDGTETETDMAGIISAWLTTPAAKQVTLNSSTGGGALGSGGGRTSAPSLGKLSGPALAKMSDSEFRSMRQSAIAQGE